MSEMLMLWLFGTKPSATQRIDRNLVLMVCRRDKENFLRIFCSRNFIFNLGIIEKTTTLNFSSFDRLGDSQVMNIGIRFKLSVNKLFSDGDIISHLVVRDDSVTNRRKADE